MAHHASTGDSAGATSAWTGQGRWTAALTSALIALALSAGYFGTLMSLDLPEDHILIRYTMAHWIESLEVGFFFWGMTELALRFLTHRRERAALRFRWLDGAQRLIPAAEAGRLLKEIEQAPRGLLRTYLGRRLWRAVRDVNDRQASDHLDGYMKDLAEQDADESHASFALTRVIAWAIPILGFLGTVIGITIAIANITPSQLEESLPDVTAGLAVAFDTTAIALVLSMILIFMLLVVERLEGSLLARVEVVARQWLGHRFIASGTEATPYLAVVQAGSQQVIEHTRLLVERQADVWAESLASILQKFDEAGRQREKTFDQALGRLVDQWKRDTAVVDSALAKMDELQARMARLAELMIQRTGEERALVSSQDRLAENLRMLRQTQSFDEALHSLTAAIHLLTVRARSAADDPHREPKAA